MDNDKKKMRNNRGIIRKLKEAKTFQPSVTSSFSTIFLTIAIILYLIREANIEREAAYGKKMFREVRAKVSHVNGR